MEGRNPDAVLQAVLELWPEEGDVAKTAPNRVASTGSRPLMKLRFQSWVEGVETRWWEVVLTLQLFWQPNCDEIRFCIWHLWVSNVRRKWRANGDDFTAEICTILVRLSCQATDEVLLIDLCKSKWSIFELDLAPNRNVDGTVRWGIEKSFRWDVSWHCRSHRLHRSLRGAGRPLYSERVSGFAHKMAADSDSVLQKVGGSTEMHSKWIRTLRGSPTIQVIVTRMMKLQYDLPDYSVGVIHL